MKLVTSLLFGLAAGWAARDSLVESPAYLTAIDTVETRRGTKLAVTPDDTVREAYEVGRTVRLKYPTVYKLARRENP